MCQCGKFQATLDVEWMFNDKENKNIFEIYCWLLYVYEIYVYKEKLEISGTSKLFTTK